MSKINYPKVPKQNKKSKSKSELDEYHKTVKSHPVEVTHSIKQEKKKNKLRKKKDPSIKDRDIQERAKKAIKEW